MGLIIFMMVIGMVICALGVLSNAFKYEDNKEVVNVTLAEAKRLLEKMADYDPYFRKEEIAAIKVAIRLIDEKIRSEDDLK